MADRVVCILKFVFIGTFLMTSFSDEGKMAAFAGERWRSELPSHYIFSKLREKLDLEPKANCRKTAKNLTFCLNGDIFVWNDADSVFYTTNLRQLNSEDSIESVKYQVSTLFSMDNDFKGWLFIFLTYYIS